MIGIISDIHGNHIALREVLKAIDSMAIKDIYCLGDIVGYYSQVNECCDELRSRNVVCIMGNHDWYMAANSFCPRSKSVNDCLNYQRKVIRKDNLEWISAFPLFIKLNLIFMVHGGWNDPIDEYLTPTEEYFDKIEGKYFVSGHTHIQTIQEFKDKTYCNPGSVGQPRDGNPKAAFAVWDGKAFSLHRVEYNYKQVGDLMEKAGFNSYYYGCLRTGAKNLCH
jgi:putative phosphoesterase